jgi:hypothetical protein
MLPFKILISGLLLAAPLCATTVVYDTFDAQWGTISGGNTDVGNPSMATSFNPTGTLQDGNWSYDVSFTTNLDDSLTFLSQLTLDLNATFTCETTSCSEFSFAVTSSFYLDSPLAYPLPYTAMGASSDDGIGIQMYYADDNGGMLNVYSLPAYNFSGQFPGSGGTSYFQLNDNISVMAASQGTTFTGSASLSLGNTFDNNAVPEPATGLPLAAMLAGGLGWWWLRRRRSR